MEALADGMAQWTSRDVAVELSAQTMQGAARLIYKQECILCVEG